MSYAPLPTLTVDGDPARWHPSNPDHRDTVRIDGELPTVEYGPKPGWWLRHSIVRNAVKRLTRPLRVGDRVALVEDTGCDCKTFGCGDPFATATVTKVQRSMVGPPTLSRYDITINDVEELS